MTRSFGPRRGVILEAEPAALRSGELDRLESFDLIYRSLCAILYNYAPTSGHPGGSISSGRFVAAALFESMDYDIGAPLRRDADMISYAAGHKALGLYAMWALRDEVVRLAAGGALPAEESLRLRMEDLLGFRRNPSSDTRLARELRAKALDGHPTPATPFVPLATGASGVGMASSLGLAVAAADLYGADAPRVHIIEGEGGLTPGRVSEALAFAGTASLGNAIVHLDWNQASIDSDRVTREGELPGDYVQWEPAELFHLHDWNVVEVADGLDFKQVLGAQRQALALDNGQPTAIVYRTTKGWRYGVEGRASHGAGHALCSAGFYQTLSPLLADAEEVLPTCGSGPKRCADGGDGQQVEACYWLALGLVCETLRENPDLVTDLAGRVLDARRRLEARRRRPRTGAPLMERVFAAADMPVPPAELELQRGAATTLRKQLGRVLGHLNRVSAGSLLIASADLLESTSVAEAARSFPQGFYNARTSPLSRTLAVGGIAEDAMSGILSGISSFGAHIGVGSSYGAFLAPLGHISARLHAIGNQARQALEPAPYRPFIMICGHAGLKTGEDGPTHADPQALQLLQENFPAGTMVTLTPWDPQEIWFLLTAALRRRPAVIAPFVTRPTERSPDRAALRLAPPSAAVTGVYRLREAQDSVGAVVLQGSDAAFAFVNGALPLLEKEGIDVDVIYVASAELFDALPAETRERILPESLAMSAMGITGFTLPTMYRWIRSDLGRSCTLHPYRAGHYPGSGPGPMVLAEAGLDGESQFRAIARFVELRGGRRSGLGRRQVPAVH